MSQPNVTVVVGKRKKKEKNLPTTNPFWSQIPAMSSPYPTRPVVVQPSVRWSLTEVPLTGIANNPPPTFIPHKTPLIDLVDDNSPYMPSNNINVSKNITMNTNKISATNIGKTNKYFVMNTGKNKAMNTAKNAPMNIGNNSALNTVKISATNIGQNPAMNTGTTITTNTHATNSAKNIAMNTRKNPPVNTAKSPAINIGNNPAINTGNNPAMNTGNNPVTSMAKNTAINMGKIPAMNIGINSAMNSAFNINQTPVMNIDKNIGLNTGTNPGMNTSNNPSTTNIGMLTGKKRRKNKAKKKAALKNSLANAAADMNPSTTGNTATDINPSTAGNPATDINPNTAGDPGTDPAANTPPNPTKASNQPGTNQPKIFTNKQKRNWLKTVEQMKKKRLQELRERQALTIPDIKKSETSGIPTEAEASTGIPQNMEAPQKIESPVTTRTATPTSDSTQVSATSASSSGHGLSIPTLDKTQTQGTTNTRSNAGSFFKKSSQQLPRVSSYDALQHYPKGIPKSFLFQQQKSQEDGYQQTTTPASPIWPTKTALHIAQTYQALTAPAFPKGHSMGESPNDGTAPIFVQTENQDDVQQPYSPSDIYADYANPEPCDDSESSEISQAGQKRLSAFQRLGPLSQPKKPKLTINLMLNKEQPVREVVNDTEDDLDRYTPVHLRQDIIMSTDETVVKYLTVWPWRKNVGVRRSATARNSRSVMILEQEQMEEAYEKDNLFIQISVKGYPSSWTKEHVLDAILDSVRGYSLIPCFTEFSQHECKFLTLRSRSALIILHKTGFYIHKDGVELAITISQMDLTLNQIDFIPRIILRKRVAMGSTEQKLNLSAFTLQDDISHFIYFPLSRMNNQSELIQIQSVIAWEHLTSLDLSHNKLTTISGFDLHVVTPRMKHLNLSHNYLEKITFLINCRELPLNSIHLEGNPLCNDYIDPEQYIKVLKLMFPTVVEIDGIKLHRKGELPSIKQNYCPVDAQDVAEKFLETYFPLLDSGSENRSLVQGMYDDDATLTITYCYKLRYGQIYRCFRNLFLYARFIEEGQTDSVMGAMAITKLINRWPHTEHDPFTFTVDVLQHTDSTTIIRIGGVLKLTADTLAEDEHLLTFTRTIVLYTEDGVEYKIQNEMVYWDEPTTELAKSAFRVNTISQKKLNLKIESTSDEDLRAKFLKIFMKLTSMDKKISERCLELNNWNFKLALEHFTKLLKLNNLDSLTTEVNIPHELFNNV